MGNKKGKQKQNGPVISNNQTQPSTVEQVKVPVVPDNTLIVDNSAEAKGNTWGATAPAAWGMFPATEPPTETWPPQGTFPAAELQTEAWPARGTFPVAEPQLETWSAQGTLPVTEPQVETWPAQDGEAWDTAEALLQPPSAQVHNNLSTSPGNFAQNRALSEIEESPDEYDESWHRSESNSAHPSESQTITAAAPSFVGSPTAPVEQSTSVLQEAMKKILTQGKSTASEAARKMEKVKAVQFREPVITAQVEKSDPHQGLSSASVAAAAAESSRKQTQGSNPGKKGSNSKTIPWTHPKEFRPGARPPAPLPVDPSWISTGGNAWSNKHRNGFQNQSRSPGNEYLGAQHLPQPQFQQPQFQQPPQLQQQFQQPPQFQRHPQFQHQPQLQQHPQFQQPTQFQQHAQHIPQTRPQAHQSHHLHPTQPQTRQTQSIRPLYNAQTKDHQDWQDWGRGQRVQSAETESDDETVTEHEGDQWGRSDVWGQNQNANGEWGQGITDRQVPNGWGQNQNAAGGWGNPGEGRGQRTGGGWDQGAAWGGQATGETWGQGTGGWAQEPTNPMKDERKRKSQSKKGGDEWGQGGDAWGQGHEIPGQKGRQQQGDAWGQLGQESASRQSQDAWGQHANHQGGQGGDTWGQGASTWSHDAKPRGGQGDDTWAQDANYRGDQGGNTWGQDTTHRGGQGGDAWGQGASAWGQDNGGKRSQGGDAWGQGASGWDQDTGGNRKLGGEWAGGASSHAAWGDEAQRLPKVTTAVLSEATGSRNVLSGQQRSQILSNLLHEPQIQNLKGAQSAVKYGTQKKTEHEQWGAWEARDHGWGSDDEDNMDDARRVRFSPKASELWGESPRSIPSKTLARAQQGLTTTPVNDPNNARFVESKGAAFEYVTNAFFGNSRFARERIHWLFPSDKDPRVAAMLAWVQKLSYNLGTFGLIKFLQTKERGGLFINAIFRMRNNPREPALDWLTFNQLQGTMDKALQESVAFYDPAVQVMVFVYLPSASGNSIAIWRLKINVPDKTRSTYQAEINAMVKSLRKHTDYIVCVDEHPPKKKPVRQTTLLRKVNLNVKAKRHSLPTLPEKSKEKRKWWQLF